MFVTVCLWLWLSYVSCMQLFIPRLYPLPLMYDSESVWLQRQMYFMYLMYTLDMFHILNFAFVLRIYGTLNKMNEWKRCPFTHCWARLSQFMSSHLYFLWSIYNIVECSALWQMCHFPRDHPPKFCVYPLYHPPEVHNYCTSKYFVKVKYGPNGYAIE